MPTTKKFRPTEFDNLGSLITYQKPGEATDHCLGHLMDCGDKGVFDANFGKVPISPEHAAAHNKALDEALVVGLDENCQVGMRGAFYLLEPVTGAARDDPRSRHRVQTFTGTLVSDDLDFFTKFGRVYVRFRRKGKVFEGKRNAEDQVLHFKRVS